MKCTVHVYLLNDDFSQEYADERYEGNESELNRKHEWEDEMDITGDIDSVDEVESGVIPLIGTLPDGKEFSEEVGDMRIFTLSFKGEGVATIACSEKLFDTFEQEEKDGDLKLHLYLKDREPLSNPIPGIYIAAQDFPKALVF
jgi:hypothetical protein